MESFYEINVSYKGQHFFATAPRSARTESTAHVLFVELKRKFPKKDGYEVTATYWEAGGKNVTQSL